MTKQGKTAGDQETTEEQAIVWHLMLGDGNSSVWEDFLTWRESAPQHKLSYDRILAGSDDIDAAMSIGRA